MIGWFILTAVVFVVLGWLIRGWSADLRAVTFDGGETWFRGGDVRCPIADASLSNALKVLKRESGWRSAKEATIEVRI